MIVENCVDVTLLLAQIITVESLVKARCGHIYSSTFLE